jgi:tetratricopeptide (TPR) repeat protein
MRIEKIYIKLVLICLLSVVVFSCGKKMVPAGITGKRGRVFDQVAFEYYFVEAVKQKLFGNGGDALNYFEQCIKVNPESDAAYFQMAQIMLSKGDLLSGRRYLRKAHSLNSENVWYSIMLAGTYYQVNNIDSAIYYYEKAAISSQGKENILLTLGNLYSENSNYKEAGELFDHLDSKYGINETSTASAARNFMLSGRYEDAYEKIVLLLGNAPDNLVYNGLLADYYRLKGEKELAEEVYANLINNNPENSEIKLALCDFLLAEKKYEELLLLLNNIILSTDITRESKISFFAQIIETEELVKSYSDQLQVILMVLEASYPGDGIIVLLRTEMLINAGRIDDAILRLEALVQERPENYYAWEKLLLTYLDKKEFVKLEERGRECASRFNLSFLAKMLYATGAAENKNYVTALEELKKAEIIAGTEKELILQVYSMRADIYYKMGDFNNAFETFELILKDNRSDLTILNNYAYYLAEQNIRLKEAETMAKKVIDTEGDNTTFLDTYGWVLYKRGKTREAAKIFERIFNSGNEPDAEWYEHYGFILKKQGKCTEAVNYWNRAIKLDNNKTHLLEEIQKCER